MAVHATASRQDELLEEDCGCGCRGKCGGSPLARSPALNRSLSPQMVLALQRSAGNRAARAVVTQSRERRLARRVPGDIRITQIDATWARELTEDELYQQMEIVREQLMAMAADDPVRPAAQSNLEVLETRANALRQPAVPNTPAPRVEAPAQGQGIPRPPGLPLDGGFRLVQITDAPPALIQSLPDGQVVTLTEDQVAAATGRSIGPQAVQTFGTGSGVAVRSSSLWYQRYGYAPAGQNSVGLVAIPRTGPHNWGHTAMTLRVDGRIVAVRGFNPDMRSAGGLLDLVRNASEVEAGTGRVPARLTSDVGMFRSGAAYSVEWPLTPDEALRAAQEFPPEGLGRHVGAPEFYSARPAVYEGLHPGQVCTTQNCGLWAIEQIEGRYGGTVGRPGGPSVSSVGRGGANVPFTAHQPEIVSMLREGDVGPLAGRPATVGSMSRGMRYMRIGGRVFLVVGVVVGAAEIATAPEEQRTRTAVSVGGGFLGGFALGATAGLFCGPGAPVCSVVAGLTLGIAGTLAGSAIAEGVYDAASAPPGSRPTGPAYPGHSIVCPSCHDRGDARPALRPFVLETELDRASRTGPGRTRQITDAEAEMIRRWLEPAQHAPAQ